MKFNDETKAVKEFSDSNRLPFGVSKVQISAIGLDHTDDNKEFVEVEVVGANGEEDSSRLWFTSDKAANFSFNVLRQIYVHNAPEEVKEAARETMDAVKTTEELVEKLQEKLLGGECWFTKYYDPSRTYTTDSGTFRSVNRNVFGYEPKLRTDLMPQEAAGGTAVDKTFPGATPADSDTTGGIPKQW